MSSINDSSFETANVGEPLQIFNGFYREIVLIKRALEQHELEDEIAKILKINRVPTAEEMAEVVSSRLQRWIEKKRSAARKILTEKSFSRINETLFVAAALADELFILEIDWPGQSHWHAVLLEERVFNSCYAGERFYVGVAKLLNQRVLDEQQRSLIAAYFLALRLGFSGRYRDDPKRLNYAKKQLFKRINSGIDDEQTVVCAQAYGYKFSSMQEQRLAPLTRWKRTVAQVFFGYILVGWLAWSSLKGTWPIS